MSYPKTLIHPGYAPAVVAVPLTMDELKAGKVPDQAAPARYPPVTVHSDDQERLERSRGYREPGEPELRVQYNEYPLWMVHPDKVEEIPHRDMMMGKDKDGNDVVLIPAQQHVPGRYPDKLVHSKEEEMFHAEQGYKRPGKADPDAAQAAKSAPYDPSRVHQEYPKVTDGKVIQDPKKPGAFQEYPKWVKGQLVNSKAEEDALSTAISAPMIPGKEPAPNSELTELERLRAENEKLRQALMNPSPRDQSTPEHEVTTEAKTERDQLAEEAGKLGINVKGNWGPNRIRQAIEEVKNPISG